MSSYGAFLACLLGFGGRLFDPISGNSYSFALKGLAGLDWVFYGDSSTYLS
jgi:hypothetical protein